MLAGPLSRMINNHPFKFFQAPYDSLKFFSTGPGFCFLCTKVREPPAAAAACGGQV